MEAFLNNFQPSFWYWWIFSGLLLLVELILPTTFFMWLSAVAVLVGLIVMLVPGLNIEIQLLMFAVGIIISLPLTQLYLSRNPVHSDQPLLNRRGSEYIGRTFSLSEDIINGIGKIRADDSTWRVEGADAPEGSQVRVIGLEGATLKVELLNQKRDQ